MIDNRRISIIITAAIFFIILKGPIITLVDVHNKRMMQATTHIIPTEMNNDKNNLCSVQDLKYGRWVNVTYPFPPYKRSEMTYWSRACHDFQSDKPFPTYEWAPDKASQRKCRFNGRFNKGLYCNLMKNKVLAIIGDSVSFDHYFSLINLLGVPGHERREFLYKDYYLNQVCNENIDNNNGVKPSTSYLIASKDHTLLTVNDILTKYSPDVVVLNRGAHYYPDNELLNHMTEVVFPQLKQWQDACAVNKKDCLFIWRTTSPGHPNCSQYTEPSTSIDEMEEIVRQGDAFSKTFNWDKFHHQNLLMIDALRKSNLKFEIMDAYYINILRPDMHCHYIYSHGVPDCLHTCLPKDNTYTVLLQHMLDLKYRGGVDKNIMIAH